MYIYFYLIPVFIILFFSVLVTNKIIKISIPNVQYPEIDGLRGYLAFFVFLHHCFIWEVYRKTNEWKPPSSNLFNHFGETSVVFFFMITAFLFISKLLNTKQSFDWAYYIKSRFFRLFPAYIVTGLTVVFIAFYNTNFNLNTNYSETIKSLVSWIFFTINGPLNFNSFQNTYIINAGVAWTLPYEWIFYLLLPFIGLFMRIKASLKVLAVFGLLLSIIIYFNGISIKHMYAFLFGILVAFMIHKYPSNSILSSNKISIFGLLLLIISVYYFNSGRKFIPLLFSAFIFLIIVYRNSFFNILSSNFSRKFGQITYSLYLIHGLVLFITFNHIIGVEKLKDYSMLHYWLLVSVLVVPTVVISQLSFKYIELPMINKVKKNNLWISTKKFTTHLK